MRKRYIVPVIEVITVDEPVCLANASIGRTNARGVFEVDETFPIHETGNPSSLKDKMEDHLSDDDWYKNADNWGGD